MLAGFVLAGLMGEAPMWLGAGEGDGEDGNVIGLGGSGCRRRRRLLRWQRRIAG